MTGIDSAALAERIPRPRNERPAFNDRIGAFLERTDLETPFLVMDVAAVVSRYRELQHALPGAVIYYAAKANPLPEIIRALAGIGSSFDAASTPEIEQCLALGVSPGRISFGHTVKKASAIAAAHAAGIDRFCCDSVGELEKIARHAPGANVTVRLLTHSKGAEWPLSRKFGCDPAMACDLLDHARTLGVTPFGLSFHVGSQQTDPNQWDEPIALAAALFQAMRLRGIRLHSLTWAVGSQPITAPLFRRSLSTAPRSSARSSGISGVVVRRLSSNRGDASWPMPASSRQRSFSSRGNPMTTPRGGCTWTAASSADWRRRWTRPSSTASAPPDGAAR